RSIAKALSREAIADLPVFVAHHAATAGGIRPVVRDILANGGYLHRTAPQLAPTPGLLGGFPAAAGGPPAAAAAEPPAPTPPAAPARGVAAARGPPRPSRGRRANRCGACQGCDEGACEPAATVLQKGEGAGSGNRNAIAGGVRAPTSGSVQLSWFGGSLEQR